MPDPNHVIAAVIPARNEAATLARIIAAVAGHVERVFVVDDGSDDATTDIIAASAATGLRHDIPRGKAAALATGFRAALDAGCEAVVTLDADGQHDPGELPALLAAHRAHPDCLVIGARVHNRARAPGLRRFANRFADFWISWASGQRVPDSQSGFRVYPAGLLAAVTPPAGKHRGFVFESQMLIDGARAGWPCIAVPVTSIYAPGARASYFRPGHDVWWIFWMVWWKIWLSALYLPGLWRMLTRPTRWYTPPGPSRPGPDGDA